MHGNAVKRLAERGDTGIGWCRLAIGCQSLVKLSHEPGTGACSQLTTVDKSPKLRAYGRDCDGSPVSQRMITATPRLIAPRSHRSGAARARRSLAVARTAPPPGAGDASLGDWAGAEIEDGRVYDPALPIPGHTPVTNSVSRPVAVACGTSFL